jgi:hypothetical protein
MILRKYIVNELIIIAMIVDKNYIMIYRLSKILQQSSYNLLIINVNEKLKYYNVQVIL